MEDFADQLIRRALARRPPPRPGPRFVEDVLRTVTMAEQPADDRSTTRVRRRLAAAVWLLAAAASVAVLARVEWSSAVRSMAWGLGLILVPLAYSAALWPRRFAALLALWSGPLLRDGRIAPRFAGSAPVRGRG